MGGQLRTRRSLSKLTVAISEDGIKACPTTIRKWLRALGYSMRVNRKCLSLTSPPGRDEQFKQISDFCEDCCTQGIPVISVDTNKKELLDC